MNVTIPLATADENAAKTFTFVAASKNALNRIFAVPCFAGDVTQPCFVAPFLSTTNVASGKARWLFANYAPGLNGTNAVYEGQYDPTTPGAQLLAPGQFGTFDLTPAPTVPVQGYSSVSFLPGGALDISLNSAIAAQTIESNITFVVQPPLAQPDVTVPDDSLKVSIIIGLGTDVYPYRIFSNGFVTVSTSLKTTTALFCNMYADADLAATYRLSVSGSSVASIAIPYKNCTTLSGIPMPNIQQPNANVNFRLVRASGATSTITDSTIDYPLHYQAQQNLLFAASQFVNNDAPQLLAPSAAEAAGTRNTIQGFQHRVFYLNYATGRTGSTQVANVVFPASFRTDAAVTGTISAVPVAQNLNFQQSGTRTINALSKPVQVEVYNGNTATLVDPPGTTTIAISQLPKNGSTLIIAFVGSQASGRSLFVAGTETASTTSNAPPVSSSTGSAYDPSLNVGSSSSTGTHSSGGSGTSSSSSAVAGGGGGGSTSAAAASVAQMSIATALAALASVVAML